MKIHRTGITRIVFEFDKVVVKIPNFLNGQRRWITFISGILANAQENTTWKWNSGPYENGDSHLLCPILWCSWGAWVIIQRRCDVGAFRDSLKGKKIIIHEELYGPWITAGFGGDDKDDNYGILDGRVVKFDYGS